jgi:predicted CXXCH cytochrome family protein
LDYDWRVSRRARLPKLSPRAFAVALGLAACASEPRDARQPADSRTPGAGRGSVAHNVSAEDYAGSGACTPCHSDIAASFAASPMHRMTRFADSGDMSAPFKGETLHFKDDTATLERKGLSRFVRLTNGGTDTPRFFRVTRVIGGHYREDFVGVPVASEDAPLRPFDRGDELVLPVSYLIEQGRLRYKGYSVMVHERPQLEPGPVWNRTCLFCHNAVPYLDSLLGAFAGPHAPRYQGEVVDALLPEDRAWQYVATDTPALAQAVAGEAKRTSGPNFDAREPLERLLRRAIDATRDHFTGADLLEVGIGCESCHGGSREHVRNASVLPSFEPVAPFLSVRVAGSGTDRRPTRVESINHACARCHQVLFSRYRFTWEGGKRDAMPGGSNINSGEGRDYLLGACSGAMSCTTCHDPHAKDERAHLIELATPAGNRVCLGCHGELAAPAALRIHAHHDPTGAGGSCIACHMPKKNMSLDTRLTRYHRIGSPTDPLRVLNDRPIECALCHSDKSAFELISSMQRLWHKAYDAGALRTLYGETSANVLQATLARGKPHEQAVALAVLGEGASRDLAPLFARELDNEYPLVREFARAAFLRALGPGCELSMYEGQDRLRADAEGCLRASHLPAPTWYAQAGRASFMTEPSED